MARIRAHVVEVVLEGERQAAQQREPRIHHEVVTQLVPFPAEAQPADGDCQHPDDRRRRASQQHRRQRDAEQAAGDVQRSRERRRRQVADGREGDQDRDLSPVPLGVAPHDDRDGERRNEQRYLDGREPARLGGGCDALRHVPEGRGRPLWCSRSSDRGGRHGHVSTQSFRILRVGTAVLGIGGFDQPERDLIDRPHSEQQRNARHPDRGYPVGDPR